MQPEKCAVYKQIIAKKIMLNMKIRENNE